MSRPLLDRVEGGQAWANATAEEIKDLFVGSYEAMWELFKFLTIGPVPKTSATQYDAQFEATWTDALVCDAYPAINDTSATTTQRRVLQLNQTLVQPSTLAIAASGTFHLVQAFWFGAPFFLMGEVKNNVVVPLPNSGNTLPQQLVLKYSQLNLSTGFAGTQMYGNAYGMPALITPPDATNSGGNLPPYSDPAWNQGNVLLINPQYITPRINPASNSIGSYSAVLVMYSDALQPFASINLADNFTFGRLLGFTGVINLNSSATGVITTGSSTVGLVVTTAVGGMTQATLAGQDPKYAETARMSATYAAGSIEGGIVMMQGPEVLKELQVVDFTRTSGNQVGGQQLQQDQFIVSASGISGTWLAGNVYQAAAPVQPAPSGPFKRNGLTDVQTGVFAISRFYSANWTMKFQYAQSQQLPPTACQIGDFISNTYPQSILSTTIVNSYGETETISYDPLPPNFLPIIIVDIKYGPGMTSCGDVGCMIHYFLSLAPDGTGTFLTSYSGLGVIGKTGADSSSSIAAPFGVVPCMMQNEYVRTVAVEWPINADGNMNTNVSYVGSQLLLNPCPNAMYQCTVSIEIPQLFASGAQYPASWAIVQGAQAGQQLNFQGWQAWQVVGTQQTKAVQDNVMGSVPLPISGGFAKFMKMLYKMKSPRTNWFTNSITLGACVKRWQTVMEMTGPNDMWEFFAAQRIFEGFSAEHMRHFTTDLSQGARGAQASGSFLQKVMNSPILRELIDVVTNAALSHVTRKLNKYAGKRAREDQEEGDMYLGNGYNPARADGRCEELSDDDEAETANAASAPVWGAGSVWSAGNIADEEESDDEPAAADGAFVDSDGVLYFNYGSLNGGRGGPKVSTQPWVNLRLFNGMKRKLGKDGPTREFSIRKQIVDGMKGLSIAPLTDITGDGQFKNLDLAAEEERRLERAEGSGIGLYNATLINEFNTDGMPVLSHRELLSYRRLPFDQGLFIFNRWVIPGSAVHKAFRPVFLAVRKYLRYGTEVPIASLKMHLEETLGAAANRIESKVAKWSDGKANAKDWTIRILQQTDWVVRRSGNVERKPAPILLNRTEAEPRLFMKYAGRERKEGTLLNPFKGGQVSEPGGFYMKKKPATAEPIRSEKAKRNIQKFYADYEKQQ